MSRPTQSKNELFAQNLAIGMEQLEAYHQAGYKGKLPAASRKANMPDIKLRVAKLQGARHEAMIIDRKWVMDELVDVYKCARTDKEWNTARATLKDIGLELGMFIERKDIRVHAMYEKLSDRDVLDQIAQANQELLTIENAGPNE